MKNIKNDCFDVFIEDGIKHFIAEDDGSAAKKLLSAGLPVYQVTPDTPEGLLIKIKPDGTRQIVIFSRQGDKTIDG